MFCTKCGTELDDDARYCTQCGADQLADTAQDMNNSVGQSAPQPESGTGSAEAATATATNSSIKTIVICAVVAVIVIAGVAIFFVSQSLGNNNAEVDGESNYQVQQNATTTKTDQGSSDASAATESASTSTQGNEAAQTQQKEASLTDINLFLSNFTEADFYSYANGGYDGRNQDSNQNAALFWFATKHNAFNNPESYETAGTTYTSSSKTSNFTSRMALSTINNTLQKYFGKDLDTAQLDGTSQLYQDGYVYFKITNGKGQPVGVAYTKSVDDIGSNQLKVTFDVYGNINKTYDCTDKSLYSMTSEELAAKFGATGPLQTGEAIIQKDSSQGDAYQLVSYSVSKPDTSVLH